MSATETKSAQGWSNAKLSDLLTVLRGVTYKKEHATKEPRAGLLPILRANNIQDGLVFEDLVYVPKDCVSETQMLRAGDIVIAASSGSRHIVGKAAQLKTDWRGSFGTFCFGLRPKSGVNPGYLSWFLQTSEYRHQVSELSAGVNINNLRATHIEEIPIAVAPPDEQRRIVAEIEKQFTRLEAGMAALRRVQANLKRYRAAILKAACEGRLVPNEAELAKTGNRKAKFETGGELLARILTKRRQNWQGRGKYKEPAAPDNAKLPPLPEGWAWATMPQLGELNRGKSKHRPRDEPRLYGGPYPFVQTGDIRRARGTIRQHTQTYSEFGLQQSRLWPAGTLAITIAANIAETALLSYPACFPDSVVGFVHDSEPTIVRYVEFFIRTAKERLTQFAPATAQKNINLDILQKVAIPIPPLAEQTRIVMEVERRLSVVEELEATVSANLQRATRLRQSILQRAFTGELVAQKSLALPTNIIALPPIEQRKPPNRHFARALLSAEIVHRLHREPTFGRIKHQKIFHLCEHIAQIEEIQGQYHREAAGPLDNKLIYANVAELKKQKWYQEVPRESHGHAYQALDKSGGHKKYVERYWPDKLPLIEKIIELMRGWNTERCEIFCTAYAAWNDLVLWGKQVTEDNILHEILERWHDSKKRIPKERWLKAIAWMKKEGFVPTGFGKTTKVAK